MWKQRERVQWFAEGDKNTKFFHQKASTRKKKNIITRLVRPDGTFCMNRNELESMTWEFYDELYRAEETICIEEVLSHVPRIVTSDMNACLDAEYMAEEVKMTLFQMFPTKAPGPNGYPSRFFQKH